MDSGEIFGEPIQILKFDKETKYYSLDISVFEEILLSDEVKNCNIAVISIAGAFRKGKSFLLSFFLRYLDSVYTKNIESDWLGDQNTPLLGFSWRGGSERNTTGIWVWSKVYVHYAPDGEKKCVILMDTQGTFDNKSTMRDNVTIFSLSTMLSSVQMYNIFDTIQENDLQHLQLFTEYGKLAMQNSNEKAFQQLSFLIRDWRFPYELEYGFDGGQSHLDRILATDEDQDEELTYVRTHLKSCFEKFNCFLMPHPGPIAAMSEYFMGQINDIDEAFIDSLKELVPKILAPENLLIKKINGQNVLGKDFIFYIESYWKVFLNGSLPTAKTIFAATTEANLLSAVEDGMDRYENTLNEFTADDTEIVEFNHLVNAHNDICMESLNLFIDRAAFGDDNTRSIYYDKLENNLNRMLTLYLGRNEAKRTNSMNQTIENMSIQIEEYQMGNAEQAELLVALQDNLNELKNSTEQEKQTLENEIHNLRNQPRPQNRRRRGGACTIQ